MQFAGQECENPRDRVFALLGLCYRDNLTKYPDIPMITADYNVTLERLFYSVLADCDTADCYDRREYDQLQSALNLPYCEVETPDDADEFVQDVLGHEGFRDLCEFARHTSEELTKPGFSEIRYTLDQLTKHELIQKNLVRERSVKEVSGRLERLIGLTREDMLKDPEGVYLEVLGRLFYYDKHPPPRAEWIWNGADSSENIRKYRNDLPGISGNYTSSWEVFTNVLRRTLGMPLMDYAILRDMGPG